MPEPQESRRPLVEVGEFLADLKPRLGILDLLEQILRAMLRNDFTIHVQLPFGLKITLRPEVRLPSASEDRS